MVVAGGATRIPDVKDVVVDFVARGTRDGYVIHVDPYHFAFTNSTYLQLYVRRFDVDSKILNMYCLSTICTNKCLPHFPYIYIFFNLHTYTLIFIVYEAFFFCWRSLDSLRSALRHGDSLVFSQVSSCTPDLGVATSCLAEPLTEPRT